MRQCIVLVEPQEAGNIGAVCRAMKNMGFSELIITGRSREDFDSDTVYTRALHAKEIYRNARFTAGLEEALAGSSLSAGVTRRRGKYRKYFSLSPEKFAERSAQIGEGRLHIVFGRESSGLTDRELALCNLAVHIPSDPAFPSLNLSHAVQVITYVLYRHADERELGFHPVTRETVEELRRTVVESFEQVDFFKQGEQEEVGRFFADIFARAQLSDGEAARLKKMFAKLPGLMKHRFQEPR
jgi:TrmH family RNA methyltransferase